MPKLIFPCDNIANLSAKNDTFDLWSQIHSHRTATGAGHLWPSETLIRLFKGRFISELDRDFRGKSVLDVGCGDGNNLLLYASLGLKIFATEISNEVCQLVSDRMNSIGYSADIRVGENSTLPFADNSFDYLVSWNTIHYEPTAERMSQAIREYARVLKPGGRFFISTTGRDHLILEGARSVGPNQYQIAIDDFRRGQTFFYFDDPSDILYYFEPHFRDVLVGRTRDELFSKICDFWLITGVKS